jgi:hypothetical protein
LNTHDTSAFYENLPADEALALVNERQPKHIEIDWQFSIQSARSKLTEKQTQLDQLQSVLYLYQQIRSNLTFIGKPILPRTMVKQRLLLIWQRPLYNQGGKLLY